MEDQTQINNRYTFTFKEYECECIFLHHDSSIGYFTKMWLRKEGLLLKFELFTDFIKSNYSSTKVGIKVGTTEEVIAHKVDGLIQIGCMTMTQQEFNKFYNLIKFKKNEYIRQSSC